MPRSVTALQRYRAKRSADVTNEPFGYDAERSDDTNPENGAFVVHLHDATRRHYDFRLEVGGELMSFSVPHGPSLDPTAKHLAVKTEDHPIEYLEFEDVIPKGEYGGGPMIVWDRGAVTYLEGPPEDEIAAGKLHVELRGQKLRGRWAFVKLPKAEKGTEWILFKKEDETADKTRDIVRELPGSVLSGLRVEELAQRGEIAAELEAKAKRTKGAKKLTASLAASRRPLLTGFDSSIAATAWHYDPELGGIRVLAVKEGDVVTLRTWPSNKDGNAEDIEQFYPEVVRAMRALAPARIALDGELVAFDASGRPNRNLIAHRASRFGQIGALRASTAIPIVLVANDLLSIGEIDTRGAVIEERRALLSATLPTLGFVRTSGYLDGAEEQIVAACTQLGIGGMIAKPAKSTYSDGRAWRRVDTGAPPNSLAPITHARAVRKVTVSNREKLFWPAEGYTKGDLIDYYNAVADLLVPFLKDRPIILVRYPDGIDGKNFYQWRVPWAMPPWIRTIYLKEEKRCFLVEDTQTLMYIANLGCIPIHMLAARAPKLEEPDFFTIDFDVKQSNLQNAITLAITLKGLLEEIGLVGYPKTSGQTGLHVLVPLGPGRNFETAKALAELLGRLLCERHPDIASMDRVVGRRGARVYVDTVQTGPTRAIVAPYSVRATPGATVSTPLSWSEVGPKLDPTVFTMKSVPKRIAKKGDLLAGFLEARPDVPGAVAKLVQRLTPA